MKNFIKKISYFMLGVIAFFGAFSTNGLTLKAATIASPTAINAIFTDAKLQAAVQAKLGLPSVTSTVTQADLDTITEIILSQESLPTGKTSDLSGIEHLNNLEKLSLSSTAVVNLDKLSTNTELKSLTVENATSPTTNVQMDDAGFASVSNLINLEELIVPSQKITNLNPISGLTKLRKISVEANDKFESVSGIEGSINTLEEFRGSYTKIEDLTPFTGSTKLKSLVLFDSNVSDLTPLSGSISLEYLQAVGGAVNGSGGITDVTPLRDLPNLKFMGLRYNAISEASQFATGFNALTSAQLTNQTAKSNETVKVSSAGAATMTTFVKGIDDALLIPSSVYDAGIFDGVDKINWAGGLKTTDTLVGYTFSSVITVGGITTTFSGDAFANAIHPVSVIFDSNGGTVVTPTTDFYVGDLLTEPTEPTKTDLQFNGWFTDNGTFANPWNFSTDTLSNTGITLYAQWGAPTQTITWHFNDTVTVDQVDTVSEADSIALLSPTRTGYIFDGWFTDNGTFANAVPNPFVVPNNPSGTNTDFYAKWTKNAEMTENNNPSLPTTGQNSNEIVLISMITFMVSIFGLIKLSSKKKTNNIK